MQYVVAIINALAAVKPNQWLLLSGILLCIVSILTGIPWFDVKDDMREKGLIAGGLMIVLGIILACVRAYFESRAMCRYDDDSEQ